MVWLDPKDMTVQGYVFSLDILSVSSAGGPLRVFADILTFRVIL